MSTCLCRTHQIRSLPLGLAGPQRAAMADVRWPAGSTILVEYQTPLDAMGLRVRQALQAAASEWSRSANLRWRFVEGAGNPLIPRVTVNLAPSRETPYGTYCSYLGTENAAFAAAGETSMHLVFDPRDPVNTDAELARVCLHELGHVLGLIHEHERPDRPILWNQPAVWRYYHELTGGAWSWAEIQAQVIDAYDGPLLAGTLFDPLSIMMYPVPPGLAEDLDGQPFVVGWNETLSMRDRLIAATMYPYPSAPGAAA